MNAEPKPEISTELVRRVRVPESFVFGPSLQYGALSFGSGGNMGLVNSGTAFLRDPYCNAVTLGFVDTNLAGGAAIGVVLRLGIVTGQKYPMDSDVLIFCPATGPMVVPLFCNVFAAWVYVMGTGGTAYPANVKTATSVVFS